MLNKSNILILIFCFMAAPFMGCVDGKRDNPYDSEGINYQPPVINDGNTYYTFVNDTITIECSVTPGNAPIKNYIWFINEDYRKTIVETTTVPQINIAIKDSATKYYSVVAIDTLGISSRENASYSSLIKVFVNTGTPTIDHMINKDSVAIFDSVSFRIIAHDTNGTISKYVWALNGKDYLDTSLSNTPIFVLFYEGRRTIAVKAIDDDGLVSKPFYDTIIVSRIKKSLPTVPNDKDSVIASRPTLRWNHNPYSTNYEIQITSDTISAKHITTTSKQNYIYSPIALNGASQYFWRIRAFRNNDTMYVSAYKSLFTKPPSGMSRLDSGNTSMGSTIGCTYCSIDEAPLRNIYLSPFWIDSTEVTIQSFIELTAIDIRLRDYPVCFCNTDKYPAHHVTWYESVLYCNARSKRDNLDTSYTYSSMVSDSGYVISLVNLTFYPFKKGYRLPTEAEWEYAYKKPSQNRYYYWSFNEPTDSNSIKYAWYNRSYVNAIQPIRQKTSNAAGLYDMAGNVLEWCNDYYKEYSGNYLHNPLGPETGTKKVLRGGDWSGALHDLRSTKRFSDVPMQKHGTGYGFRVVLPDN
ncbi:MAG: SUMF1/EgtB/PvdO family nonheme iron enzyme [Fibrobacteres bacterium]|nr:SUMF1/EgtB/PvdO family nonheme iron enzyme [Fibrobacterota bacterium]